MGYRFQIVRNGEDGEEGIPRADWLAFVKGSPDLEADSSTDDSVRWKQDGTSRLGWSKGRIEAEDPSPEFLSYLIGIAPQFGGRVKGETGEFYRAPKDAYVEEKGREIPWSDFLQRELGRLARHHKWRFRFHCLWFTALVVTLILLIRERCF